MSAMPFLHLGDGTVPSHTVTSLIDYYNWYYARINQERVTITPSPPVAGDVAAAANDGDGGNDDDDDDDDNDAAVNDNDDILK